MIVGLLILIQAVFADAGFCPVPLQGKSGGNLSFIADSFGPFDSKKCILEQVGNPSNCHCEGQEKVFAEKSLIDADDLYKQAIDEATEDAYIKSYQSTIKQIFQGTIAADVYLKDKKLKEEDLIRFNGCRPNAMFEVIKELENTKECGGNPTFKRRLAKLVGSRKMNLLEAEDDKKALSKKSVSEIIESGKNAFYGQIIAIAQNVPIPIPYSTIKTCVPYKAYLEFSKSDISAAESWQELTHDTNQIDFSMPEDFPFKGSVYQLDVYNSEDRLMKDYIAKVTGTVPLDDFGFSKGLGDEEPVDTQAMVDGIYRREMRRIKAMERHPFLATILNDPDLRKIYENFVGNEDERVTFENGVIKDADFMKKIMETQNKKCGQVLEKEFIKGLLCGELPKPSKEVYASKILPSLYRDRENYPAPGLSYALVKKFNDNYCPKKPSRPGAPVQTDDESENALEKVLSPLTNEMSGLGLLDSPYANESGYAKFNEKMCPLFNQFAKDKNYNSLTFMGEQMASLLLSKISPEKLKELAEEKGIDVETLKKQLNDAVVKTLNSRFDDEKDELLEDVKSLVEDTDEEFISQIDSLIRFYQSKNMQYPKESVASRFSTCQEREKCDDPNYWGERLGREIYGKLTEQDRKTLSEQFKIPPEQLEAAIIKDLQQKTASTFVGNMPLSMMLEDLGLQAISALETNNEKDALAITDFITHVQDRNKLGRRFSDFPSRETSPTEVNITELLAPEREMVEGRSLFSDYAVNGERRDQTALEELAPVLAERDRNTIGVSSPIEIPYQRRMVPAPPSSDFPPPTETLPIGRTPTDEPSVLADRPTSGSGKGVSKSGGLTSAASELSSLSTSKEPVSTVVREETRPSVETPRDRKPDTSEKDSLNDAIARANKSLDDYKKAIAAAGPNPEDNPDVQRLRRELDAARAAVEDSKNNLAAIRNARNNGGAVSNNIPVASNDWQTAAGNGGRVLSDPFDPVSSATALPTRGAAIDPGVQGGATSAMSAAGGGKMSSESVAGGMSVAPRGTLSAAQARQSLKDKGIISDDTPLPFEFQNPIAQALLFEDYPNIDESRVLSMLSMLGLEGMDFKTIETVGENASEHIVRFFGIDTVAFHGRFDPLRRCEKPMEDLKSRMKMFEDIKRLRAQSKKEMLAMISKQICLTQEKRVGYDEYQRLVDVLLNQDRMLERIYAVTREKSRSLNRGPASEN